jgi:putative endonuclease
MDPTTHHRPLTGLGPTAPTARAGAGSLGRFGEAVAAQHLVADDGLQIVARNWRLAVGELRGELDLIAVDHAAGRVVICEVKTRRDAERFGGAISAVPPQKRARIRALAAAFLRDACLPYGRVRLDLIAIDLGRIASLTHVEGAL